MAGKRGIVDPKQVAKNTARVLQNYLTYQALRTVIDQLSETNPPMAFWLQKYSGGVFQDGEAYLQNLMQERKDLVLRILAVREDLADSVVDFLPEMVRTNIQQSNMETRRQLLERMTSSQPTSEARTSEHIHPELTDEESSSEEGDSSEEPS